MKTVITALSSLALFATLSFAQELIAVVTPDQIYDKDSSTPVEKLSCPLDSLAAAAHTDGVSTIGDLIKLNSASETAIFSVIALPPSLFDNGKNCGSCWFLEGTSHIGLSFLAVDQAHSDAFVIAQDKFDRLTGEGVLHGGPGFANITAQPVEVCRGL